MTTPSLMHLTKRGHLENLGIDENMTQKCILKKHGVAMRTEMT